MPRVNLPNQGWGRLIGRVNGADAGQRRIGKAKRVGDSAIDAGGTLTIKTGSLEAKTPLGVTTVLVTGQSYAGTEATAVNEVYLNRSDGSPVLAIDGADKNSQQWRLTDHAGTVVVSEDQVSGTGLARPYIPFQIIPVNTVFPGASYIISGWTAWITGYKWHPRMTVGLAFTTSSASGANGSWSITDNLSAAVPVPATGMTAPAAGGINSTTAAFLVPGNIGDPVSLQVNLSGWSSPAWAGVTAAVGIQS